jgi:hypothetical protein
MTEAVLATRIAIRKRMAEVRKEYEEAMHEIDIIRKIDAIMVSFDRVSNLRERAARLGGYLAALEFSLEQIVEKL